MDILLNIGGMTFQGFGNFILIFSDSFNSVKEIIFGLY